MVPAVHRLRTCTDQLLGKTLEVGGQERPWLDATHELQCEQENAHSL